MSMLFASPLSRSAQAIEQRQVWGEFFGQLVRSARETRHLSVEAAASRAGMTAAAWEAVEAGRVPRTREQLRALAAGLEVDGTAMAGLAILCRQAWGR
jgi:transcriptional regulator with XRE-family HTH domain